MSTTKDECICRTSWEAAENRGGCNFCTRHKDRWVWAVRSNDENRHLEVRLCESCMAELRQQTRKKHGGSKGDA